MIGPASLAAIPFCGQTMINPLESSTDLQSPDPWHPVPDIGWMPGATDLATILGARSVLVLLPPHAHLRANCIRVGMRSWKQGRKKCPTTDAGRTSR
jgi:hypothetical protein